MLAQEKGIFHFDLSRKEELKRKKELSSYQPRFLESAYRFSLNIECSLLCHFLCLLSSKINPVKTPVVVLGCPLRIAMLPGDNYLLVLVVDRVSIAHFALVLQS
jgi:hypothetical protein